MIILRKMTEKDLETVMNWRMLPEVTKYMYTDPELTVESQKEWFKNTKDNSIYFIIEYNNTDVGLLSVVDIDSKNKHCSWGDYIANENMRGKGIGKAIECNIYDYIFYVLKLNKVNCEVFAFNEKVVSNHLKYGCKIEGLFRKHIFKNGEYHNIIRLGLLKEEWEEKRKHIEYAQIFII